MAGAVGDEDVDGGGVHDAPERTSRQNSSNWGDAATGPYEDLHGFLTRPGALAKELHGEGLRGMKIWPFDRACWTDPAVRMNDGACDPSGRFWCGSMAYDLTPGAAALWRWNPDGHAVEVLAGIGCSNGLAWTRAGSRACYVDSLTCRIDLLSFGPDGEIDERRLFADVAGRGFPDGITVDRADGVWLAMYGSGVLLHFDRTGRFDETITVPVRQVTACTFGGPDYSELYITTSRHGLHDPEPLSGAVFWAVPDQGGFEPYMFAG